MKVKSESFFLSVLLLSSFCVFAADPTENLTQKSRFIINGTEFEKCHWLTDRKERRTVLNFAARNRLPDLDQFILSSVLEDTNSAVIDLDKDQKNKLLFAAVRTGNLDALQRIIELCSVDVKDINESGLLPYALYTGTAPIVHYLLETYPSQLETAPNFNSRNDELCHYFEDVSALQIAAHHGNTPVVRYLIEERGMNPNETNRHGYDIFDYAFYKGGSAKTVEYLATKLDINLTKKDNLGRTRLLKAADRGNEEIVKYLIEVKHADPRTTDNDDHNIFQIAARGPVLWYLIEKYDPVNGLAAKEALVGYNRTYDLWLVSQSTEEEKADANGQLWLAKKRLDEAVDKLSFR